MNSFVNLLFIPNNFPKEFLTANNKRAKCKKTKRIKRREYSCGNNEDGAMAYPPNKYAEHELAVGLSTVNSHLPWLGGKRQHRVPGLMAERQHSSHRWSGKGSAAPSVGKRITSEDLPFPVLPRPGGVEVRRNGCSSRPGAEDEGISSASFFRVLPRTVQGC